ncbi:MAG: serine hydrolase [Edaphobacter sp.]|uniref:serine hydrolase n=1 Tax=Edaphobacter sp. TaxID=1934404 RepID=UPI00239976F4|nr:serine hydrolase [Edaphobacter sp.]MDE1178813.1 serine hydrolase [Edaphobacter sp.]
MTQTRRGFVGGMAAALGGVVATAGAQGTAKSDVSSEAILALFKGLPGEVGIKIHAPAADGRPEFVVEQNAAKRMFVGSAFKTFVLCETLRQVDGPDASAKIAARQLDLDASVWSLDSATFNPPNLIGKVSQRTALEAMILHSDNTGTDMCLKAAGPDKVRSFISSIGLKNTLIPDSTRVFFGYLLGAKNYETFTWDDIMAAANAPMVNSPMNTVQTLAASADDLVSYYSRALAGKFFEHKETLLQFRQILSMGDAIWKLPMPLGGSCFVKGGSIDVSGFHAVCLPGGMLVGDRWVYFCITINWDAKAEQDPATVKAFVAAGAKAMELVKERLTA